MAKVSELDLISTDFLSDCADSDSMFLRVVSYAKKLGFDFAAFGMQMPFPLNSPKIVAKNNYGSDWWNIYQKNNYFTIDPVVKHVLASDDAVVWSNTFFSSAPEFWESARQHGLRFGWTKGMRDDSGTISQLSFARTEDAISESELLEKEVYMRHLAEIAHLKMASILVAEQFPESLTQLTTKELEAIRWCADGKTNVETALILGVSTSAINFHINNVLKKLGASNKAHAVMKASRFGLLGRPG